MEKIVFIDEEKVDSLLLKRTIEPIKSNKFFSIVNLNDTNVEN